MSDVRGLIRQAGRALSRRPLYAVVATLTVAAGIAASTASFVLVDAALLSPLPFRDPQRLVTPDVISPKGFSISLSVPNYGDWSARNRVLETSTASAGWGVALSGRGAKRILDTRMVLGDFFTTLGLSAEHGRPIAAAETERGAAPVAVLGWGFFQELGADPALVGSTLVLDDIAHTVVGVLPAAAGYPTAETAIYLPLGAIAEQLPWEDRDSSFGLRMLGRLRAGVTLAAAQADFDRVAAEVRELEGRDVATPRLETLTELLVGDLRAPLLLLFVAATLVVCLAVANVGNLVLARSAARRDELAVRVALGAPRWDLFRLQLAEASWIAAGGSALGAGGAFGLVALLRGWIASELPLFVAERLALGPRALSFAAALAALVAVVLGGLPALSLHRDVATATALHGVRALSSRESERFRSALVVGQLALGTLLAVGALKLATSLDRLRAVDKGFEDRGVVMARLSLLSERLTEPATWSALMRELVERARALPGAQSASLSLLLPLTQRSWELRLTPEGVPFDPHEGDSVLFNVVSSDHFATLGVELLRGRRFAESDRDGGELVTVVDETLAERYWPGEDPIGKRVTFETDGDAHSPDAVPVYRTIVGVVANVRHYELQNPSRIQVYVPLDQARERAVFAPYLLVRTDGATGPIVAALPRLVAAVDADVVARQVTPLASRVDESLFAPRLLARAATALGSIALALAGVGIFAVASYGVAARRRELGLRQALGAAPRALVAGVLRRGLRWCVAGAAIGTVAAIVASRLASSLVWGVGLLEPAPYVGSTLLLAGLSLLACALPAFEAMRVDPAVVLRDEM